MTKNAANNNASEKNVVVSNGTKLTASKAYVLSLIVSVMSIVNVTPSLASTDACYQYYNHSITKKQKAAVDSLDFIALYKEVFFNFKNSSRDEWLSNFEFVKKFHAKVKETMLTEMSEADVLELAKEVQDTGYFLPQKRDAIDNVHSHALGSKIPDAALKYLESLAVSSQNIKQGLEAYHNAYENFNTSGNKIKVSKLGLTSLTAEQQAKFFQLANKQLTAEKIATVMKKDEVIINLYQQSFNDMLAIGKEIKSEGSRKKWNTVIVENQTNALVNSMIVSKISADMAVDNKYLQFTEAQRNKIIWMLYTYVGQYNGAAGFSMDSLVRSKYEQIPQDKLLLDQTIDRVVSRKIKELESRGLRLEMFGAVRQTTLARLINDGKFSGQTARFVKDAPTFAIKITEKNWETLPANLAALNVKIGTEDRTKYPNGLKPYIGSALNIQMAGGTLDIYPIDTEVFRATYKLAQMGEVEIKNAKYAQQISKSPLKQLENSSDIISILKIAPTEMVLMSQVGFDVAKEARIQSPWGDTQTKRAGEDAYLAILKNKDGSIKEIYIVQIDAKTGLPLSYVAVPQ